MRCLHATTVYMEEDEEEDNDQAAREPARASQCQPEPATQPTAASQPTSQPVPSQCPASQPASQPARQAAANSQQPLDSLRGPGNQTLCKGPSRPARQQPTASRWLQGPRGPEAAREAQPASQAAANSQQPADGLRCPGDQRLRGGRGRSRGAPPPRCKGLVWQWQQQ